MISLEISRRIMPPYTIRVMLESPSFGLGHGVFNNMGSGNTAIKSY